MTAQLKKGSWIVTIPLVFLSVAYLFLFHLPSRDAISEATDTVQQRQQFIQQGAGLLGKVWSTQEEVRRADDFVTAWKKQSPATTQLSSLYGEIYALAEKAGTATTNFNPQAIVRGEQVIQVPLRMGCRGTFSQVFAFLRDLESLPHDIWVTDVEMEGIGKDGESVGCQINLMVFANNSESSGYAEQTD